MAWLRKSLTKVNSLKANLLAQYNREQTHDVLTEKEKKIEEACIAMKTTMDKIEDILSGISGLEDLKEYMRTLAKGVAMKNIREASGIDVSECNPPINMMFISNRCKEDALSAAMIIVQILKGIGRVGVDNCLLKRPYEALIKENVEKPINATRCLLQRVERGLLILVDVHELIYFDTVGMAILEEIKLAIDKNTAGFIFISSDELLTAMDTCMGGFFKEKMLLFRFPDYSMHELAEIACKKINDQKTYSTFRGFKVEDNCTVDNNRELLDKKTDETQRRRLNGRLVDHMLENAKMELDARLSYDAKGDELVTIRLQDLEKALCSLPCYSQPDSTKLYASHDIPSLI